MTPKEIMTRALKGFREAAKNLRNPKVYEFILNSQHPRLCVRADERSLDDLLKSDGFPARASAEQLAEVRAEQVEQYQQFNEAPFGYGVFAGTNNLANLARFLANNGGQNHWLHSFVAPVSNLSDIKRLANLSNPDATAHDDENESIVIRPVPVASIAASIAPQHQKLFLANAAVPNQVHNHNQNVPSTVKIENLASEEAFLRWQLGHGCILSFGMACDRLFGKDAAIDYKKFQDPNVVVAIDRFLSIPAAERVKASMEKFILNQQIISPAPAAAAASATATAPAPASPAQPKAESSGMGVAAQIVHQHLMKDSMHLLRDDAAAAAASTKPKPVDDDDTVRPH